MSLPDPTRRFSSRVENYIRFRPGYPAAVFDLLESACGLVPGAMVADLGSGTGIFTEGLLARGATVHAVEPNREMREAGERLLAGRSGFHSHDGRAEATGIPAGSVDLITAGQAFHWFDQGAARAEFLRILKPGGCLALVWNERRTDSSAFLKAYEALLLRFATDYVNVNHTRFDASVLQPFFGGDRMHTAHIPNHQDFDFEGLRGRLLSSSYAPDADHPDHQPMLAELRRIFDAHAREGQVRFEYDTLVYHGQLDDTSPGP